MDAQDHILGNRVIQNQSTPMSILRDVSDALFLDTAGVKICDHNAVQFCLALFCLAKTRQNLHQFRLSS